MNTSDIWMRLEALAHLRGLPQLGEIKRKLEAELAEYNDSLKQSAEPKAPPPMPRVMRTGPSTAQAEVPVGEVRRG